MVQDSVTVQGKSKHSYVVSISFQLFQPGELSRKGGVCFPPTNQSCAAEVSCELRLGKCPPLMRGIFHCCCSQTHIPHFGDNVNYPFKCIKRTGECHTQFIDILWERLVPKHKMLCLHSLVEFYPFYPAIPTQRNNHHHHSRSVWSLWLLSYLCRCCCWASTGTKCASLLKAWRFLLHSFNSSALFPLMAESLVRHHKLLSRSQGRPH